MSCHLKAIVITLFIFGTNLASASGTNQAEILSACKSSIEEKHDRKKKEAICECISKKHTQIAEKEEDQKKSKKYISWVVKFYSEKDAKVAQLLADREQEFSTLDDQIASECAFDFSKGINK